MSSKPTKKIVGGVLAALLALFAAVVVATPAVADPAGEMANGSFSIGGYTVQATTNPTTTDITELVTWNTNETAVVVKPGTQDGVVVPGITVSGTGTVPLEFDVSGTGANPPVLTLNGVNTNSLTVTGGTQTTAAIVLSGSNTITARGGSAITVSASDLEHLAITGSGTLTATSEGSTTVTSTAPNASLQIGVATGDTNFSANALVGAPTVNVSNTAAGTPISSSTTNLVISSGATLNASTTGANDNVINLGTNKDVTVKGTLSVSATNPATKGITAQTVTIGDTTGNAPVSGTLTVDAGGAGVTGDVTLNAGTVNITSVTGSAIVASSAVTVNGGTFDATSDQNVGIVATDVNVNGGTVNVNGGVTPASTDGKTAAAAHYGIQGNLTVSNGSSTAAGPTVTIEAGTVEDQVAVNAVSDAVKAQSQNQNYKWVCIAGEGLKTVANPKADTVDETWPTLIYGFAGMNGDEGSTATELKNASAPKGSMLTIKPDAVTTWGFTVSPFGGDFLSADMPNGYMVACDFTGTGTNGYVYYVNVAPTAFSGGEDSTMLAKNVYAAKVANPNSALTNDNSKEAANQILRAGTSGIWVTDNATVADNATVTIAAASGTGNDLLSKLASGNTVAGALYTSATVAPTEVPVSFQLTFNGQYNAPISQPAPTPAETVTLDFGAKGTTTGSQTGVYFTTPGTGDVVYNVPDPNSETYEPAAVTELPTVNSNQYLIGWYVENPATETTNAYYGPAPITEVPTLTQNATYMGLYGTFNLVGNPAGLGGSPVTIMAGETGNFTADLEFELSNNPAGVTAQDPEVVFDPSVADLDGILKATWISYGDSEANNGAINGVKVGDPTLTANEDGTYTLNIPVVSGSNASQGAYKVTAGLALNGAKQDATDLLGVINIDGVAENAPVAVMRLYNPYDGEHLLTTAQSEITANMNAGWRPDGIAWYSPAAGDPVYRLYNPYSHDHYYTSNTEEIAGLVKLGWTKDFVNADGSQTPVFYGDTENSLYPIAQLFNPYVTEGTHLWTMDMNEVDTLEPLGWVWEGVKWYALMPGVSLA